MVDNQHIAYSYADRLGKVKIGASSFGATKLEHLDLDMLEELAWQADRLISSTYPPI